MALLFCYNKFTPGTEGGVETKTYIREISNLPKGLILKIEPKNCEYFR